MNEMTSQERIEAALALQPVDRVPIILNVDAFSARVQGVKLAQVIRDLDLARDVMIKTFDDLGGWDAPFMAGGLMSELGFAFVGMSTKLPGFHLGEDDLWQLDEKEIMKVEDHEFIQQHGWNAYLYKAFPLLDMPVPQEEYLPRLEAIGAQGIKDTLIWEAKGYSVFAGMGVNPPFESISFTRSLKETMLDIFRRPDTLRATQDAILAEQLPQTVGIFQGVKQATQHGWRVAFIGSTRAPFLAPKHFERFYWSDLKQIVDGLLAGGITPMLHFDSNWDRYLEWFLDLPKGKVLLELDSATDIFKAKKILKGHMCLMGDVPPAMLKLGTPEEVTAYCKRLIDEVGDGGGFILSQGCDVPVDAKPENVRAIIETGKSYYPH